ncbi:hypothetical protein ACIQZN_02330 [Streptomyces sp. NPDC097595]
MSSNRFIGYCSQTLALIDAVPSAAGRIGHPANAPRPYSESLNSLP